VLAYHRFMLSVKPWRAEAVIQLYLALLFCICFGGLISEVLGRRDIAGFRQMDDFGNIFLRSFSFQGSACLLAVWFLKSHHLGWRDAVGFRDPRLRRVLFLALAVFVIVLPSVWLLQWASVSVLTSLGWPTDPQLAVKLIENAGPWTRAYLAVFAVGFAPVAEEFIFRGVLYPFIKQLGWPKLAVIGVSFLFALIHFDVATFLPLFVLALVLTWIYERTDNLLAPIVVHALFNAANLLMLLLSRVHVFPKPE